MQDFKNPKYRSEPGWDNSRNVSTFGRRLYPVSASTLKHRGTVLKASPVDDGQGNYTFGRTEVRDIAWMSISLLKVDQTFEYRGKTVITTHMIKMRHEALVEKSDHILIDNIDYEVVHVDRDEHNKLYKAAMCTVWEH